MNTLVWTMTRMIVIMGERGRERGRVGKDRIMGRRDRKKKNSLSWRKKFEFRQHPTRQMSPCYGQGNYGSDNWTREEHNSHSSFKTCVFLVLTLIASCAVETMPIHYMNAKYLA